MQEDATDRIVVKSMVDVAKAQRIEVLAKCVETEAVLQELTGLGVDLAQGYLYHRPAPMIDVVPDWPAAETLTDSGIERSLGDSVA
ncbi:MAG: EAL domain-containing protein, partial [Pseudomonadota bacterium]